MNITPNAAGGILIGQRAGYADQFTNGLIPEVIGYNQTLNTTDRMKVESYLAVKYGIAIDQTVATDYIDSTTGVFRDATINSAYTGSITSVGRDDRGALNQKQAKSINPQGLVTIALGNTVLPTNASNINTFGKDRSFFTFADNNADMSSWTGVGAPAAMKVLTRTWKTQVA